MEVGTVYVIQILNGAGEVVREETTRSRRQASLVYDNFTSRMMFSAQGSVRILQRNHGPRKEA